MKKINYFYIDESGSISNNSGIFIHGCVKTDSPQSINDALKKLMSEFTSSLYYEGFKKRILKEGFHATENNPDMRADVYKLIPLLDYRAYIVITKKESDFFKTKMSSMDESDYFEYSLRQLIMDRIYSHKEDKNIFFFETIQLKKRSLKKIIEDLFNSLPVEYDCEYKIVGKEEENMGIVDYLNFLFNHIFEDENPWSRMKQNISIVSPKIAIIKYLHNNIFLSRKKEDDFQVNLENIIKSY